MNTTKPINQASRNVPTAFKAPTLKIRALTLYCTLIFSLLCGALNAQNLLSNGEFEENVKGWTLRIPPETQREDCNFELSEEKPPRAGFSGKLSSVAYARYGAVTSPQNVNLVEGQRYRVSAWVRAGEDFVPKAGTPGFLIRITLFSSLNGNEDASGGHYYLGLGNRLTRGYGTAPLISDEAIPKTWTQIEAVFEIPAETAKMDVSLFVWEGVGSIYVGDAVLELVDDATPLTPILK